MSILPWGKRAETLKKAEDILSECVSFLDLPTKKFSKDARTFLARRNFDDAAEMKLAICFAALNSSSEDIEARHFIPSNKKDSEAFADARFEKMSLEEIVGQKVAHFFTTLGKVETEGVYSAVLRQVEKPLIEMCLKWADGNQIKTARVLGINRNTLHKKMLELKIKVKK